MFGERRSRKAWWLLLPAGLLYVATFAAPLAVILVYSVSKYQGGVTSFGFFLDNYRTAFTDGLTLPTLLRTIRLAAWITVVSALLAVPVALQMRRSGPLLRMAILTLIISPLLTSVIVRNVAWLLVLGRNGLVNEALAALGLIGAPLGLMYNEAGVVVAVVHVYLPFMVLPIYAALLGIDPRVEESAASLGASPFKVFWRVTLPLAAPGLAAGATLTFVLSMGVYLTPVIMGGGFVVTLPMLITDLVRNQYNWSQASAVAVLLLVSIGVLVAATLPLQRRRGGA